MAKNDKQTYLFLAAFAALLYWVGDKEGGPDDESKNNPINVGPTPTDFIAAYTSFAQLVASTYGIPVDTTLAQGGLESSWGTSDIFKNTNNVFGIHADSSWSGATYTPPGDPNNAAFRKYDSVEDSFMDYGKFLSTNSRYAPAFALNTVDPVIFAQAIANAGYSESGNYGDLLTSVINTVQKVRGQ
jgi:flagellum-specific peptidoglycan hydrolase FlgJ